ncbi:MAG: hypothetical protein GY679_01140 [Mycoplasma sp.]|nr:hypothetical protein [Mycoplasma sp.]
MNKNKIYGKMIAINNMILGMGVEIEGGSFFYHYDSLNSVFLRSDSIKPINVNDLPNERAYKNMSDKTCKQNYKHYMKEIKEWQ